MLVIGCDHAGYPLKMQLLPLLKELNIEVLDVGCDSTDAVDYPIYAESAVDAVLSGRCDRGILICGTGIGISMVANRYRGIRCALCGDVYSAMMARSHNDANMLAMGARVIGFGPSLEIVKMFLNTPYSGGIHETRLRMYSDR